MTPPLRPLARLVLLLGLGLGCREPVAGPVTDAGGPRLREVAAEVGLDFRHTSGARGELYFVEIMGPGGAFLDYDGDGDLDVFLPQGHALGPGRGPTLPADRDRLFRNLQVESGRLAFEDVSAAAGLGAHGYGVGVATGDVDNDGDIDLYLTQWGPNELLLNQGDGRFVRAGKATGVDDDAWGVAATFFDADADGWLDLALANYVDYRYENHRPCYAPSSARDYCGPHAYAGAPDRYFRNRGGRFESVGLGAAAPARAGLGIVASDFDADGHLDLYVANDQAENDLWLGDGRGGFVERAVLAGVAVNRDGAAEASMGIALADADEDGHEDLFVANLNGETNVFYRSDGRGGFQDVTPQTGLGPPSVPMTGFGTDFFDWDGDARLDLFVANGDVRILWALATPSDPLPTRQRNQLYRGLGQGRFAEVPPAEAGPALALEETSRGLAVGDVDNDGDADLLVTNANGPVRLLLTEGPPRRWLGLAVEDGPFGPGGAFRDALGAQVSVALTGGRRVVARVHTDGSYASARDPRVLIALRPGEVVERIEVRFVGGHREAWTDLALGRYHTLTRGTGAPVGGAP